MSPPMPYCFYIGTLHFAVFYKPCTFFPSFLEPRTRVAWKLCLLYSSWNQEQRGKKETLETLAVSLFAFSPASNSFVRFVSSNRPLWQPLDQTYFLAIFAIVSMMCVKYEIWQHMIQIFLLWLLYYNFNIWSENSNKKTWLSGTEFESCLLTWFSSNYLAVWYTTKLTG